ncbi:MULTISPECIES: hypothetical protein [unclassified Mesorhizobium]|uniref:hypothetical protein n=1 Tax=unclassified Mesorhizobium TaxID=325217 RepID=UPI00333688FD
MDASRAMPIWKLIARGDDGRKVMSDVSRDEPRYVYQMLRWQYAKQIFETGILRLRPVRAWQDPFEKWWCDKLFNGPGPLAGIQAYGSCWTTGAYDEPRWRMAGFGNNTPIVRIRTRMSVMLNAAGHLIDNNAGSLFLGLVLYRGEDYLRKLAQSVGSQKQVTRVAATMLLHKRYQFKFEDEVRLLWLDKQPPGEWVFIKVDPNTLIDQVMITPHATDAERQMIEDEFKSIGVPCKSSLILREPR